MSECPICLENIGPSDLLGRVHQCLHTYHKRCVVQWSSHSNSCPTCRKRYYGVDIIANDCQHRVLETLQVKDKLIENDAINHIPPEYIIPPPAYTDNLPTNLPDETDLHSGVCTICSSARYSRTARSLLPCISCGAQFHKLCLGHTNEPYWFCPVCDCRQEMIVTSRARLPRRSVPSPRRGLLIFNENNEIEEFDDADELVRLTSVLNGGILLRREARAIRNLTPEEASSWELLEQARNGSAPSETGAVKLESDGTRRKRRRPQNREETLVEVKEEPDVEIVGSSSNFYTGSSSNTQTEHLSNTHNESLSLAGTRSESRIASLIGQIKRKPNQNHNGGLNGGLAQVQTPFGAKNMAFTSETLTLADSDSGSEVNSEKAHNHNMELTLEQKRVVQKHVRNHLRPMYKPNSSDGLLSSEEQYIRVNKSISRKVYASILDRCMQEEQLLDKFFEDEQQVKELVDGHVEGWNFDEGK